MVRPVCDGSHRFTFETQSPPLLLPPELPGSQSLAGSVSEAFPLPALHLWSGAASAAGAPTVTPRKIVPNRTAIFFLNIRICFKDRDSPEPGSSIERSPQASLLSRLARLPLATQGAVGLRRPKSEKIQRPKDQRRALSYERPFAATTTQKTRSQRYRHGRPRRAPRQTWRAQERRRASLRRGYRLYRHLDHPAPALRAAWGS